MTWKVFLMLLVVVSTLTSLVVEALKKFIGEDKKYSNNLLAGLVAIVLSIAVGVCYCIFFEIAFSSQIVIYVIALVLLGWLCSMLGYDKVVQSLAQLKQ